MSKKQSPAIDQLIGRRIRTRRMLCNISQSALGRALPTPLSFQAIQKYESGECTISAPTLVHVAKALDTPPSFFLIEGLPIEIGALPEFLDRYRNQIELAGRIGKLPRSTRDAIARIVDAAARPSPEAT